MILTQSRTIIAVIVLLMIATIVKNLRFESLKISPNMIKKYLKRIVRVIAVFIILLVAAYYVWGEFFNNLYSRILQMIYLQNEGIRLGVIFNSIQYFNSLPFFDFIFGKGCGSAISFMIENPIPTYDLSGRLNYLTETTDNMYLNLKNRI